MKYETQSYVRVYRTWLCQAAILANAGKTLGGGTTAVRRGTFSIFTWELIQVTRKLKKN